MADKTTNFGLTKPDKTDFYDIAVFNENADIIDTAISDSKAAADKGVLSTTVYSETSGSQTARAVTIAGVTSWDDVLGKPVFIKAATYGTSSAATLSINSLGAKSLSFPDMTGTGVTATPQYYWVRTGQVYCVIWTGTYLLVGNMQVRSGTTGYAGIVQLSDTVTSTSTALAATANAAKTAYDKAADAQTLADDALAAANGKADTAHTHAATDMTSGTLTVSRGGTGATTLASGYFLKGNGTGAIAVQTTAAARSAMGLGSSTAALDVAYGGTGATTADAARSALGLLEIEEGTWTPTASYVSSYGSRIGRYTKIGSRVIINFFLDFNTTSSASGAITISGLPYANAEATGGGGILALPGVTSGNAANGYYIAAGGSSINPRTFNTSSGYYANAAYQASAYLVFAGTIAYTAS